MADNNGPKIFALAIVALVLSYLMIGLRISVRVFLKGGFAMDDFFAVLSLAAYSVGVIAIPYGVIHGIGRHMRELSADEISTAFLCYFLAEIFYALSTWLIKISFCFTLLRIVNSRLHKVIIYSIMSVVSAYSIFFIAYIMTTCDPISHFWTQIYMSGKGSCRVMHDTLPVAYTHGAIMIVTDITLAVLPARAIWSLNLNKQAKMSVTILLSLGSLASVATIIRMPYIAQLANTSDFLYVNVDITMWSVVEVLVCIITTSAGTLRPLARKLNIFSSSIGGSKGASNNNSNMWASRSIGRNKSTKTQNSRHSHIIAMRSMKNGEERPTVIDIDGVGDGIPARSRTGSSDEIMWEGKHGESVTSEVRSIEDDVESIPSGRIQRTVEFTTTTHSLR